MVICGMGKEVGKMEHVKKDIERFFEQTCFVTEWEEQKQDWGETILVEKEQKKELPCRLCRNPKIAVTTGVLPAEAIYDAVLLFRKSDVILPGSKVEVIENGNMLFSSVGEMISYQTHNEIALKRESTI